MPIELTTAAAGQISGIKASLFLDNVDNTSDLDKPVSTAQQAYITGISGDLQTTIDGLDASHHVTYNGATGDVNLGVHKIVATTGEFTNLNISSNIVVGGTVLASGDFVDVYNNQTVNGVKTFSDETIFSDPEKGIRVDAINSNGYNGYILFNETLDVRDQIIQWGSQGYFHNPAEDIIRMTSPWAGDMLDFDGANSLLVGYKPLHLRTTAFVGTDLTVSGNATIKGNANITGNIIVNSGYMQINGPQANDQIYLGPIPSANDYAGIWFRKTQATANTSNYSILGDTNTTLLNAPTTTIFRINNSTKATLTASEFDFATQVDMNSGLNVTGDVNITGNLTLNNEPTQDKHAATKKYVDDHAAVSATTTTTGHVELATDAEAHAATDDNSRRYTF
jgi:hypothetical protein